MSRFERACPAALRQTKFAAHDLRQHYNKAEYLEEESGDEANDGSDGGWPQHVDHRDLADDDRVMLWQPEPATGLGNSLQVGGSKDVRHPPTFCSTAARGVR